MAKKRLSAERAIKRKCLECSGNSKEEVLYCEIKDCALYPFRLGEVNNQLKLEDSKGKS